MSFTGNAILLEFSHGVADGRAGLAFLLHLVEQYLSRRYQDGSAQTCLQAPPLFQQIQNGYTVCAQGFRVERSRGEAYHIRGTPSSACMTTYALSAGQVRKKAKSCGATVTEYLSALLCQALMAVQQEDTKAGRSKKIRLEVPVDLRTRFPHPVMRNFYLCAYPELTPAEAKLKLGDICRKFHRYMQVGTTPKRLAAVCGAANQAGGLALFHAVPLELKGRLLQRFLELPFTSGTLTFSN